MAWARHYFRNEKQKVWVQVDAAGAFVLDPRGRPQIRYQNKEDAKIYNVQAADIKGPAPSSAKSTASVAAGPKKEGAPAAKKKAPRGRKGALSEPGEVVESAIVPRELTMVPAPKKGIVEVYTDGACQGNPGPCSYGALVRYGDHYKEMSQYLGLGTNNVGELTAIGAALATLNRRDLPVQVHTDSTYAIGVLTKSWKAKANAELIAQIRALMATFDDLTLIKVKGHSGLPLNDRVDTLAVEAIERAKARQI